MGSDGVFHNTMSAGGGAGSMFGGLGQIGMIANLKKSMSGLGSIGMPKLDASGNPIAGTGLFGGHGVGGWQGGALLAGGAMLGMDGLKRGGGWGMLEDTMGGAAIGGKFGGWMGAAIGAGVGALVGGIRWALGGMSPEDQMKQDVKTSYGVSIDTAYAKSLAQRAGGIDPRVFIQRADIRDEIMLYAQMSKQGVGTALGRDTMARGVNLQENGGTLYQAATYSNGGAYGYQSTLGSTGSFQTLAPAVNVSFSLNGQATTAALGGAVVATTSQCQGRAALNANLNSPLAVMV
jgi:hypothetical protein